MKNYLPLSIVSSALLDEYRQSLVDFNFEEKFEALDEAEISTKTFSFYTSVASVYSSKIEGEEIELDSYIKHKSMGIEFQPDYTKKTDDLYDAYSFAMGNTLTPENLSRAHTLLSKNLVESNKQGKFRTNNMFVTTDDGRIEYVAVSPYELNVEMDKWYADALILLNQEMSIEEAFYYAAFLHLTFVKIHPWNDGNGRSARLIEKWFLGQKLGEKAGFLQSEKHYYLQHAAYYLNLRELGLEYTDLDYTQALPFLSMLPFSLNL